MFENNTYENILNRMLSEVSTEVDKSEGTFYYDSIAPSAFEIEEMYIGMDEILKVAFAQTSYDEWLDKRAGEFGVDRKVGTKAAGDIVFTGSEGTVIPSGTLVQTESGLQYFTTKAAIVEGSNVIVPIVASDIGVKYNVIANTITKLPVTIAGISSLANAKTLTGGSEPEADQSLLQRLLFKMRNPVTSGNKNHYKEWALEVDGVGDAIIIPIWDGPGTVKVIVLDANKRTPSQAIVDAVKAHIEDVRPIGAAITVVPAIEVPINISVTLELASYTTLEEVKALIQKGVTEYISKLAFKDPLVRITRVENVLLDIPPIIDFSNLKINSGDGNIEIPSGSVAVLGEVVINV